MRHGQMTELPKSPEPSPLCRELVPMDRRRALLCRELVPMDRRRALLCREKLFDCGG